MDNELKSASRRNFLQLTTGGAFTAAMVAGAAGTLWSTQAVAQTAKEEQDREAAAEHTMTIATAYVLPLGGDGREEAIEVLKRNRHEIRRAVGKGLQLKFSPEIRFQIDETFDRLDDTRALFADENVRRDLDSE